MGRSFLSSPLLLDRGLHCPGVIVARSWAFSGQVSGLSASEALAFLHHLGSFFHCEPVNVHRVGISFLSWERECSSWGLLPLGFGFSLSEDSLHPLEVVREAGSFFEPLFKGLGGGSRSRGSASGGGEGGFLGRSPRGRQRRGSEIGIPRSGILRYARPSTDHLSF